MITGGLSKAFSAGGYRLGYLLIPDQLKELIKPLKSMISETYSAVSAPIQYSAIPAYTGVTDQEVKLCTKIHKLCAEYTYKRLSEMNILTPKPAGAFYLFISFESFRKELAKMGITTNQQLCDYLLNEIGFACLPGDDFYYKEDSLTARIAFVDYDGFKVLEAAKTEPLNEQFINVHLNQTVEGLDKFDQFLTSLK